MAAPISPNSRNTNSSSFSNFASNEIAEIYGKDKVIKHLKDETPCIADRLAFQGKEIVQKSYFELSSGRVVEVLTFKDDSKKCIGSFTYTAEQCSREGWATYHKLTDEQWCQLALAQIGEPVEPEDWSCDWNSIQNIFYIKTGTKMTVLEAMHCFAQCSQGRMQSLLDSLKKANKKEALEILQHSDITLLIKFFSFDEDPIFSGSDLLEELLLGVKNCISLKGEWDNVKYLKPEEMIAAIKAHSFRNHGPLLITIEKGSFLLDADENDNLILIDPHNWDRSSNFYAQQQITELAPTGPELFMIKTTDLSGKKTSYRGCNGVGGLDKDINVETLEKLLSDLRGPNPLTTKDVNKEFQVLGNHLKECESLYQKFQNG